MPAPPIPAHTMTRAYKQKLKASKILVEPIYRRQPGETDHEWKLYLIYRDLNWDVRSQRMATAIALGVAPETVKEPHFQIMATSAKWQWPIRVEAYDVFVQEYQSDRQERVILETKSDIEHTVMKLVKKIKRINTVLSSEELETPEIARDIAVLNAMLGKEGNCGKFLLDAYKTIVGQKLQVGTMKNLPPIEWKE